MPFPGVSCRAVENVLQTTTSKLIENFTLVYWDQRATGKSYSDKINKDSININQYISDASELVDKLRDKYSSYTFKNSQEYVSSYIGGSLEQLDSMKNLIVLIVICINALITILMMKTFITKEKGEIAMLKSVGFRNSSIRFWQSARISIVLVAAIILGCLLSKLLGPVTAGQVFAMLGVHNIVFKVKALEVYAVYPVILFAVTTAIAYLSAGTVKKVDLKEINNME
jgi:putative ABC transport system permease protein